MGGSMGNTLRSFIVASFSQYRDAVFMLIVCESRFNFSKAFNGIFE
jgi:hypothetical protein